MKPEERDRVRELVPMLHSIIEGEEVHVSLSALLSMASRLVVWSGRDVEDVAQQFVRGTHLAAVEGPVVADVGET